MSNLATIERDLKAAMDWSDPIGRWDFDYPTQLGMLRGAVELALIDIRHLRDVERRQREGFAL